MQSRTPIAWGAYNEIIVAFPEWSIKLYGFLLTFISWVNVDDVISRIIHNMLRQIHHSTGAQSHLLSIGTALKLNSQDQSLGAFTRMSDVCVQSKRGRANNVVCSKSDATVAGCSSTSVYADYYWQLIL